MNLPVLNSVKYNLKLPVSGETIEVRPWLVSEEKALLIAKESKDPENIALAVSNILKECAFGYDVDKLSLTDVEWLLLNVKAWSSGELAELRIRCRNTDEDGHVCGHTSNVEVDLQKEAKLSEDQESESKISLSDTIGVQMRHPQFSLFRTLLNQDSLTESTFEMLASAIEYVWDGDEIFKDFTAEEIKAFIDSMNDKQLKKITAYIDSLPKLELKHPYKCEKCGYEGNFTMRNFFNFFIE